MRLEIGPVLLELYCRCAHFMLQSLPAPPRLLSSGDRISRSATLSIYECKEPEMNIGCPF